MDVLAAISAWPVGVRLLLSIAVTVGITLAFVRLFHSRAVAMSAEPPPPSPGMPAPGKTVSLAERVVAVALFGFVFLTAFTIGQFWTKAQDADEAVRGEAMAFSRTMVLVKGLPEGAARDTVVVAFEEYLDDVIGVQWPLLEVGDADAADAEHAKAGERLFIALMVSGIDTANPGLADEIFASAETMVSQGASRISALPSAGATGVTILIAFLGIVTLGLTAAFFTARLAMHLLLMGVAAGVVGILLFMVVETSNPFDGAANIPPVLTNLVP
jgi:hypothetical protein